MLENVLINTTIEKGIFRETSQPPPFVEQRFQTPTTQGQKRGSSYRENKVLQARAGEECIAK